MPRQFREKLIEERLRGQGVKPAPVRKINRARSAVSNGKKAFATNVATGASLSPHLLAILCGKDFKNHFFTMFNNCHNVILCTYSKLSCRHMWRKATRLDTAELDKC